MFTDPDGTLKWWQKLLIGVAFIVVGAIATAITGGGIAAFGSALLCGLTVAAKAAVVGAAVGLVTGGISAAINGGNILQGMLQGAFNGAVDGFMWGGITAGLTNIVKPGTLCFAAGTKVLAESGQRNIEDIKVGDRVLSYNEQTGEQEYKRVVRLFRNESKDWTGITVNGEEIVSTPGHKYYMPESRKWVSAKDLKTGDTVLLSNGERTEVESVRSIHYGEAHTTYNFEVEDFHTYYVGTGVLVHNECWGTTRKNFWKAEAKNQRYAGKLYKTDEYKNLGRMAKGLAPKGLDGKSVQLHHIMGRGNDIIVPMMRSQHTALHQVLGYKNILETMLSITKLKL